MLSIYLPSAWGRANFLSIGSGPAWSSPDSSVSCAVWRSWPFLPDGQVRPDQSGEEPGSKAGSPEGDCPRSGMGPWRGGGACARCSGRSAALKAEAPSGLDVDPAPGGDTDAGTGVSGGGPPGTGDTSVVANTAGGMTVTPSGMNAGFLVNPGSRVVAPGPDWTEGERRVVGTTGMLGP